MGAFNEEMGSYIIRNQLYVEEKLKIVYRWWTCTFVFLGGSVSSFLDRVGILILDQVGRGGGGVNFPPGRGDFWGGAETIFFSKIPPGRGCGNGVFFL